MGACLGATNDPNGARLGHFTKDNEQLVRTINKFLHKKFRRSGDFQWSSLQINKNTVSAPHRDSNNVGYSAIFLLGDFTDGDFVVEDSDHRITGPRQGMLIDGTRTHRSLPYTGTRYSVVAFLHNSVGDLPSDQKEYLRSLGFRLNSTSCGGVAAEEVPARSMVQTCCEKDNVLNQPTRHNLECQMVNITEQDDFTSRAGIEKAKAAITGPFDALWNSSPCVGGSAIQTLNIHQWGESALEDKRAL